MTQLDTEPTRLGRRRDHSRDPEILNAALDVLAEEGYDGMTVDMVAARAKAGKATLYRRWPSKGELVIDAVACMKRGDFDLANLPDTGTLRGDLVAMIKPRTIEESERKMQVMAGLMSALARSPELSAAIDRAIIEPRAEVKPRSAASCDREGRDPCRQRCRDPVDDQPLDGGVPHSGAEAAHRSGFPDHDDRQRGAPRCGPAPLGRASRASRRPSAR